MERSWSDRTSSLCRCQYHRSSQSNLRSCFAEHGGKISSLLKLQGVRPNVYAVRQDRTLLWIQCTGPLQERCAGDQQPWCDLATTNHVYDLFRAKHLIDLGWRNLVI